MVEILVTPATTKVKESENLRKYSDEALGLLWIKYEGQQGHHITALYRDLADELWKRLKNKKKECEMLRAQTDRAIRDLDTISRGLQQVYRASSET